MRFDNRTILTGFLAGLTAALLSLGANGSSSLAIFLYAASALPILIAGLGWGVAASITAVVTGGIIAGLVASPYFALVVLVVTLIPAGWIAHLANLARPASEIGGPAEALAWYPLADVLTNLAGLVTAGMLVIGFIIGYDSSLSSQIVEMMMATLQQQDATFNPDAATVAAIKSVFAMALPLVQGAAWVILLFAAYYLATRIVQASGRSLRPREDMPSTLRMHRNAIFVFLVGLMAAFFGGTIGILGALVCGTFGAGFVLAGFAVLHHRTRGKSWRLPVLWLVYLSVVFFSFLPLLVILIAGLSDTRRTIALSPAGGASHPPSSPDNQET
ncbi:Predicted membrane protein [Rhizobium sp. RU20A]|uniref:DUF2232 domain-containing protein n=1 Tax=Rhizobium sp. RU20A TaxID=1907412 RepID=UPI000954C477|nr:DUF2232 domain-containing protein [Rhizobium sp. RU20A]SIP93292.1 Predicted membrane protein [Rhizobium sp. RU20A]